jgi:hypothetical protein
MFVLYFMNCSPYMIDSSTKSFMLVMPRFKRGEKYLSSFFWQGLLIPSIW